MLVTRCYLAWLACLFLFAASPAHAASLPAQQAYDDLMDAADAAFDVGEYAKAAAQFGAAVRKKRTFEALRGRGRATYLVDGHELEALGYLTEALELRPKDVLCLGYRAECYQYLGRSEEAFRDFGAVLKVDRVNEDACLAYAELALELDEKAKGTRALTRLLKKDPDHFEARWLCARLYLYRGFTKRAIADFTLVAEQLKVDGTTADFAYALAIDGQLDQAAAYVRRGTEAFPDDAYTHWVDGLIHYLEGSRGEADEAFDRAVALDPSYEGSPYEKYAHMAGGATAFFDLYGPLIKMLLIWAIAIGILGLVIGAGGARFLKPREGRRAERGIQPLYDGEHKELFTIYVQNVVFTLLTFGVYRFWAKVRTRRFHYQHTTFADGRFDYHATGQEKFTGFLKGMAILAPLGVLWYFASDVAEGDELKQLGVTYGFFAALFMIRPLALVGGQRFNLARTSWNNLRLRFTGTVKEAYKLYGRDLLFIVFTLGLYYPWHVCNIRQFKMHHTALGEKNMDFRGRGNELFGIQFGGTFLSWITLGIYLPWFLASRHRFFVKNTKWMGKPFASSLTGKEVLAVAGPGLLASILTLGLALPWAMTRWKTLKAVTTTYRGEIDPAELQSIQDTAANSTLEGVGEAGDILGEIGDLFGL